MGENRFCTVPVAIYIFVLIMCDVAHTMLIHALVAEHGTTSSFAGVPGSDLTGKFMVATCFIAITLAFWNPVLALGINAVVALIWIVPLRRFACVAAKV